MQQTNDVNKLISSKEILNLIPHRYPFVMVDRVLDYSPFEYIVARKNVTINEPFFQGHFPGEPIMPGVMMLEAVAQAGSLLYMLSGKYEDVKMGYIVAADKVKFRNLVTPGDTLNINVKLISKRDSFYKTDCNITVDNKVVFQAVVTAFVKNQEPSEA